jgi:site-specific DNA-methyltransferase (adenine-specific)
MTSDIYLGDCLVLMEDIPDHSFDMILCDLPYGQTARNKWDTVIPFDKLWAHYNRIAKENAAVVLFANGMFTADLMNSNRDNWKYNLVWDKVLISGFLNANKMPLRSHEDICVFYKKQPTYNPQKIKGEKSHSTGKNAKMNNTTDYGAHGRVDNGEELGDMKHPKSILIYSKPHSSTAQHPTQKSVELCEFLIKTFTNEGDLVLDNCMGIGTTGIACINTNRNFIGIELEEQYFNIAKEKLNDNNGKKI